MKQTAFVLFPVFVRAVQFSEIKTVLKVDYHSK